MRLSTTLVFDPFVRPLGGLGPVAVQLGGTNRVARVRIGATGWSA